MNAKKLSLLLVAWRSTVLPGSLTPSVFDLRFLSCVDDSASVVDLRR
jgi:hypothetical protein